VTSRTKEGTAIQIDLPAIKKSMKKEPAVHAVSTGLGRILVMDDEEMVRNMTGSLLLRLGYEVELVEDGKKAVESYQQAKTRGQPFDAVILDLIVPGGMGGEETIRELVKIDPTVLAIVASGYCNDPVVQNYEQYGFRGALPKPFLINDLSEILSRVIVTDIQAMGKAKVVSAGEGKTGSFFSNYYYFSKVIVDPSAS
jgi:two-component system cell cycle sensor histidine kinase/response regulator CckA